MCNKDVYVVLSSPLLGIGQPAESPCWSGGATRWDLLERDSSNSMWRTREFDVDGGENPG